MQYRSVNRLAAVLLFLASLGSFIDLQAQSYSSFYTFSRGIPNYFRSALTNSDGMNPAGGLLLSGGTFYGAAYSGGPSNFGTIFAINTNGSNFRLVHTFTGSADDGANPFGGLVLAGGTLYGTASGVANPSDNGVIFAVSTNGNNYTNLFRFDAFNGGTPPGNSYGATPNGSLVLVGSMLYGTAIQGGNGSGGGCNNNCGAGGTIFAFPTNGTGSKDVAVLFDFPGDPFLTTTNININGFGTAPEAGLVLAGSRLYGTTSEGGAYGMGVIFSILTNTSGNSGYTVLHHFDSTQNGSPQCQLVVQGGTLYGLGGSSVFAIGTNGTGFTIVYNLGAGSYVGDQTFNPGLLLSGATLYATGVDAGANGDGQLFSVNTNSLNYADHHDCSFSYQATINNWNYLTNAEGALPNGSLTMANGRLYGTAAGGSPTGSGVLFSIVPQPSPLSASRSGTNLLLTAQTFGGFGYTIQQSTNLLASTNWITFTNFLSSGLATQFTKPFSANSRMFFRLRQN